jgi:hypothetical protein
MKVADAVSDSQTVTRLTQASGVLIIQFPGQTLVNVPGDIFG